MSWSNEDGTHEGYLAWVFGDGLTGGGWSAGGITSSVDLAGRMLAYEEWTSRPPGEVVGWQLHCNCADRTDQTPWRGLFWERVDSSGGEDLSRRRVYVPGDDVLDLASRPGVDEIIHAEWKAHIAPYEASHRLGAAAQEFRAAERQLAEAVTAARAAGNSWESIGGRLGITRQSAHERWASRTVQ